MNCVLTALVIFLFRFFFIEYKKINRCRARIYMYIVIYVERWKATYRRLNSRLKVLLDQFESKFKNVFFGVYKLYIYIYY